ncbi:protein of unknown function [Paraburkholderia kururiensis]
MPALPDAGTEVIVAPLRFRPVDVAG